MQKKEPLNGKTKNQSGNLCHYRKKHNETEIEIGKVEE